MRLTSFLLLAVFVLAAQVGAAQQKVFDFSQEEVISRLKDDIYTLASDEFEGRDAGTEGEKKAAEYIKDRFREAGLEPLFDGSFIQEFPFPGQWQLGDDNYFTYGVSTYEHGEDYFVVPGSASTSVSAPFVHVGHGLSELAEVEGFDDYADYCDYALHRDVEGKVLIMEMYMPDYFSDIGDRQMFQLLFHKIGVAQERGAAAVMFVNTKEDREDPPESFSLGRLTVDIPLIFAYDNVLHDMMSDQDLTVELEVDINREELISRNVAGYIDNGAEYTVVIGGHFDHVGWGSRGSRTPDANAIHYGADDNASGTAGVIEAARYINASGDFGNYNYIFMGFGAEEKGLIGSRYFTDSDAYDMEKINYMFNLDMIGRLEDNNLTLIGTGSSPEWDGLIDSHAPGHFNIRKSPGGRGGSDHTSFYVKDIPVIFFFTGIHDDYHTPADTPDKINYEGARQILDLMLDMVRTLEGRDRLAFSAAPESEPSRTRADGVTLGLMPDHTFQGEGLKVLSVSDNRPAKRAGIEDGDVIIRINDMEVKEIQTYMEALGRLSEGDRANVTVMREENEHTLEVEL